MKIYDPLYGVFSLSKVSSALAATPEVRRLSQIRLLNSMTPSLSTLGELRRYAHTLGVLYLFSRWKAKAKQAYSGEELDALEVAIILHDIATPPFGHLFEYLLKEELGWDHESAAAQILLKTYVAENSGHQIYARRVPQVVKQLPRLGIKLDIVLAILRKQHPLSTLIFGTLDLDNIDNVWRMGWALGFNLKTEQATELAEYISVSDMGKLIIPSYAQLHLDVWSKIRRQVYEIMVFDQPTVASQAILTRALRIGLVAGNISTDHWTLTDEQLLERLMQFPKTKKLISDDYLGNLPKPLLTIQLPWRNSPLFNEMRTTIQTQVEEIVNSDLRKKCIAYIFKEKGSFSKKLTYLDEMKLEKEHGSTSQSLIIYTFCNETSLTGVKRRIPHIVQNIGKLFGIPEHEMLKILVKGEDARKESILQLDL